MRDNIGGEHMMLLRVLEVLASNAAAGVAQMNKTTQKISRDTIDKEADRKIL
jgi:hypothetical protein